MSIYKRSNKEWASIDRAIQIGVAEKKSLRNISESLKECGIKISHTSLFRRSNIGVDSKPKKKPQYAYVPAFVKERVAHHSSAALFSLDFDDPKEKELCEAEINVAVTGYFMGRYGNQAYVMLRETKVGTLYKLRWEANTIAAWKACGMTYDELSVRLKLLAIKVSKNTLRTRFHEISLHANKSQVERIKNEILEEERRYGQAMFENAFFKCPGDE